MVKNVVLTPPDYDRDIRHYEFDIHGLGMAYSPGDCLGKLLATSGFVNPSIVCL